MLESRIQISITGTISETFLDWFGFMCHNANYLQSQGSHSVTGIEVSFCRKGPLELRHTQPWLIIKCQTGPESHTMSLALSDLQNIDSIYI